VLGAIRIRKIEEICTVDDGKTKFLQEMYVHVYMTVFVRQTTSTTSQRNEGIKPIIIAFSV